jgi:hypothetical protein
LSAFSLALSISLFLSAHALTPVKQNPIKQAKCIQMEPGKTANQNEINQNPESDKTTTKLGRKSRKNGTCH